MTAAFREAMPAGKRPLLIVGGPRFDELMAGELGVDRIFGRGTTPGEVASYLVHAIVGPSDHPAPILERTEGSPSNHPAPTLERTEGAS
jgi:hypothetical protein